MPSVVVVLKGLKAAEYRDLGFYTEDLIAGTFDVQKCVMSKGWEKTTLFPSLDSDSESVIMLVTCVALAPFLIAAIAARRTSVQRHRLAFTPTPQYKHFKQLTHFDFLKVLLADVIVFITANCRTNMTSTLAPLRANSMKRFLARFPWMTAPFVISAPMRVMSGPELALAVSSAHGLGFIGPGAKPEDTITDLAKARDLLDAATVKTFDRAAIDTGLPIGAGFQLWNGDIQTAARAVREHRPCAAWLFAPRKGQDELDEWTNALREAYPDIHIWAQVGTLQEVLDVSKSQSRPNVLVIQGAEAGGHGTAEGAMGLMSLLPEVADSISKTDILLFAAGGIADGRGVAAALALGADGVVLGTRFLASNEARISKGYQREVVRATDGARSTVRTTLYNQLRGTNWPKQYSPRGIVNKSWHDHQAGISFDELKRVHDEAAQTGDSGWGPEGRLATYAGASIGLVHSVEPAGKLVEQLRRETSDNLRRLSKL